MVTDNLYSTAEAAAFLGLTLSGIRYHVFVIKDLLPTRKVGNALLFSQDTLEQFTRSKKKAGRPKKS